MDPSEVVEVAAADVDVPLAMPHYNPFRPSRKGNERRRTKRKTKHAAQLMTIGMAQAAEGRGVTRMMGRLAC